MIEYILTALIVYIGLFIGVILSYLAKEELKPGRKYFNLAKNLLFFVMIALLFFYFAETFYIIAGLVLVVIYFLLKSKPYHDIVVYIMLGLVFYFNLGITYSIPITMFIYGLVQGTLNNKVKSILIRYIWFLAVAIGLFLL